MILLSFINERTLILTNLLGYNKKILDIRKQSKEMIFSVKKKIWPSKSRKNVTSVEVTIEACSFISLKKHYFKETRLDDFIFDLVYCIVVTFLIFESIQLRKYRLLQHFNFSECKICFGCILNKIGFKFKK